MKRQHWIMALGLLALGTVPAMASADDAAGPAAAPAAAERQPASGEVTRQWLDRQRRGSQASAKPQPLSGPVLEQVHERYRKSFTHPIPERFESERLGAGAGR